MHINYEDLEWDDGKRTRTLKERGLDFADVANADWASAITIEDLRQPYPETRYATFAAINGRLCVFAWCWRNDKMRIISLRKANAREVRQYENQR